MEEDSKNKNFELKQSFHLSKEECLALEAKIALLNVRIHELEMSQDGAVTKPIGTPTGKDTNNDLGYNTQTLTLISLALILAGFFLGIVVMLLSKRKDEVCFILNISLITKASHQDNLKIWNPLTHFYTELSASFRRRNTSANKL